MSRYFPLFISLKEKQIVVIGGGAIAARRVEKLLDFSPKITVIAPELHPHLIALEQEGKIVCHHRVYQPGDCDGAFLVLSATDDTAVNEAVTREAKEKQIPVNTSHRKERCDFYFPGLVVTDQLVLGVTANGDDHGLVKETVTRIRELWKEEQDETWDDTADRQP